MIILDTHIWIWWVSDHSKLSEKQLNYLKKGKSDGLGISIISCWEVAKLVEKIDLIFLFLWKTGLNKL